MANFFKKVASWGEDVVKNAGRIVAAPFEGAYHAAQGVGYLAEGDLGKAGKSFAKTAGDYSRVVMGGMGGFVAPGLMKAGEGAIEAAALYSMGNFGGGSSHLYDTTGIDIGGVQAGRDARAAQAEYDRLAKEASEAASRNRRAELLNMRKNLIPSLTRSAQGSTGSGSNNATGTGGIVLG